MALCLPGLQAAAGVEPSESASRVPNGLMAVWDFHDVDEKLIRDGSGLGSPANLRIPKAETYRLSEGRLQLLSPTMAGSSGRPAKISDIVRVSGEITLEVWVTPANLEQAGPATILTMSNGADQRNFFLGQDGDRFTARFRTSQTERDGSPGLITSAGTVNPSLTHLVFTRDRTGRARIFIDGRLAVDGEIPGGVGDWEKANLSLGRESRFDTPWLGAYDLVAVYGRDLSAAEVERNFRAGPKIRDTNVSENPAHLFETKIAPLLSKRCLICHDSAIRKGGLDLSKREAAFAGGASGKAIQPGNASASLVWLMAEAESMPKNREPLSTEEKALLKEWIDAGAEWSYQTLDPGIYSRGDRGMGNWVPRLTVAEYIETVRGVLGVDIADQALEILPPDLRADGFKNTSYNLNVDLGHVQAYARLAQMVVARMDVGAFAGKGPELSRARIQAMGERLLRAPVTEHEVDLYSELAGAAVQSGVSFEEAVGYVVEAMLQSPRFLYRIEQQRGDGSAWPADAHELASRLSYILWGAAPDAELLSAADSGRILDREELDRQTKRLLADPRAVQRSQDFISQWLNLDRLANMSPNAERFPDWDRALAADMRRETLSFFEDLVWKQQRPLAELLNAQFSYMTPELAKHYGMPPQGPGFQRYDLSSVEGRGGILTQGSVLTVGGDEASMVTRGLFVLRDLLFSEVGDPPPGLDTTPVPASPGRSHRQIAAERVASPSCGGCHARFEPLAFGLEKFDGLGTRSDVDEHGNVLREDGQILFPGEAESVSYSTSAEMMDLLAGSDRVNRNLTRKLTQFAIGRPLVSSDEPSIDQIHQAAQQAGGTYQSLISAIVASDLVLTTQTEF